MLLGGLRFSRRVSCGSYLRFPTRDHALNIPLRSFTANSIFCTNGDSLGGTRRYFPRFVGNINTRGFAKGKPKSKGNPPIVCTLKDITKVLSTERVLFKDISLSFYDGAKIGILGINGSGKTSLLRIIAGVDDDYEGEIQWAPDIRVGYLSQEPELDEELTVHENILEGIEDKLDLLDQQQELLEEQKLAPLSKEDELELAEVTKIIQDQSLKHLRGKVKRAMEALRCPPANSGVTKLSGGEKRRVALCKTLIDAPDFLILDEPTNHLDTDSVQWLEQFLANFKGTVLAVTHDRYFLDNVAGWILEVDRGRVFPFQGNYTQWLGEKARRIELEQAKEVAYTKMLKKELTWVNQPAKARHAKSKARIKRYEEMLNQNRLQKYRPGNIIIPPGPRLGEVVLSVRGLKKSYKNKLLFESVSFVIKPGSVVGIVGPNGSGKTTLFRIITGEIEPDEGSVEFGSTAQLGYITQSRDSLADDNSVYQEISEGEPTIPFGDYAIDSRTFVASFSFSGPDQSKPVAYLSGGERNRVHLAKMLKRAPNVLLLDEPTNDLDLEVLRKLEDAIENFAGVGIIVSHDRWFLDRLCTHIIAIEPSKRVFYFEGNYSDYLEDRSRRLGEDRPKRFTKLGV